MWVGFRRCNGRNPLSWWDARTYLRVRSGRRSGRKLNRRCEWLFSLPRGERYSTLRLFNSREWGRNFGRIGYTCRHSPASLSNKFYPKSLDQFPIVRFRPVRLGASVPGLWLITTSTHTRGTLKSNLQSTLCKIHHSMGSILLGLNAIFAYSLFLGVQLITGSSPREAFVHGYLPLDFCEVSLCSFLAHLRLDDPRSQIHGWDEGEVFLMGSMWRGTSKRRFRRGRNRKT